MDRYGHPVPKGHPDELRTWVSHFAAKLTSLKPPPKAPPEPPPKSSPKSVPQSPPKSTASRKRAVARIKRSIRLDIAEHLVRLLPAGDGPYNCPLCDRLNLVDQEAFWQHMAARHSPFAFEPVPERPADERLEDALVRIVNATSLDEAVEIATEALLGR